MDRNIAIKIRKEEPEDFESVFNLIKNAFENEIYSDHKEHFLVEKLRRSDAFIPELSLVGEMDQDIVGYILLTKINIKHKNKTTPSLALAPVAVLQEHQKKGIGGQLIREAHKKAKMLGYGSIVVLGHEDYYPRFGYLPAQHYGIKPPFNVPQENYMAIELKENALQGVHGEVEYAKEFYQ